MEQFTYSWILASSWSVVPKVSWYWQMSQVVMSVLGEISFINKEKIKLLYEYLESLNIWKYFPGLSIMYDALNLYWFYFTISYCIIGCFACPRQNNRNHNFTIHQEFVVLSWPPSVIFEEERFHWIHIYTQSFVKTRSVFSQNFPFSKIIV